MKCKNCPREFTTDIESLNDSGLCFTCFRNGVGKKMFEKGDLLR